MSKDYLILQKDNELSALQKELSDLKMKYTILDKEYSDLKGTYYLSQKSDRNMKHLMDTIEGLDKDVKKLREENLEKQRVNGQYTRETQLKFEKKLNINQSLYDNMLNKLESMQAIERLCDMQQNRILELEEELKQFHLNSLDHMRQKMLHNDMKFTDLKKKMMDHIRETQKNVTGFNMKHTDVSTKLTLLQNHQLLVELEYQSNQIEDLLKTKEIHEKRIFELKKDLEVHTKVENALAEKNKKYSDIIRTLAPVNLVNLDKSKKEEMALLKFDFSAYNDKKFQKLEKLFKKKESEYSILKLNYDSAYNKLTGYEKKISSVYSLFQIGLEKLFDDEELKNAKDIYVNIDNIKQNDFSLLNNEQKYTVLMILIKHIIPLVNLNEISSNDGLSQNLQNVKMKFQYNANMIAKDNLGTPMNNLFTSTNFNRKFRKNKEDEFSLSGSNFKRDLAIDGLNPQSTFKKTFNGSIKTGIQFRKNEVFKRNFNFD